MKNYGFNLKNKSLIDGIESQSRFELNLYKNKVLLTGDANVVEKFYKKDYAKFIATTQDSEYEMSNHTGTFWYNVGPKNARVLFGIVKMINDAFVRLVTSGGVDIKVLDGEEEDAENTERLNDILEFNSFTDRQWGKAESMQSGLGYTVFKWSIDTMIDDKPILEVVPSEMIEILSKRDFITGYKFKKLKQVNDIDYEIQEIYMKEDNKPIIKYRVLNIDSGIELPIASLSNLEKERLGLDFLKNGDTIYEFEGLTEIPVVLKNNTAYNSFFPNAPFGEADTQGLDMIEDSLSELISALVEEVRKGRIKVLISEDLIPSDKNGSKYSFDDFKLDYQIINKHEAEGKNLIEVVQGEINSEKYLKGIASMIMYACNKANLHPMTVGLTGVESIAASQESQIEREKVSMRTREMKLNSWRVAIEKLAIQALQIDDIIKGNTIGDYEVMVEFGMFTNPNRESVVDLLSKAVTGGVLSIAEAQAEYYGDNVSEEDMEYNYIQTLVEKGIGLTQAQKTRFETLNAERLGEPIVEIPQEPVIVQEAEELEEEEIE